MILDLNEFALVHDLNSIEFNNSCFILYLGVLHASINESKYATGF